ncbi:sigma-54-dependent Fis family transcriptional regulator [candidate division KSB1 bacterium]|nr:sigma-54-dependent Fis family transcriptional regulator [candidate division KSB1 bacterium]RQW01587.1 MAG: sigma-54-dependent Fis family transcriptional regulator [candidate division KSB1 bacterium]
MTAKLLLVDDDPFFRDGFKDILQDEGYSIAEAEDGKIALDMLEKNSRFDLLLLDLNLPRVSGMEVLKTVADLHPELPVLIISGAGTIPLAVEATKMGAYDFIEKDDDPRKTIIKVRNAIEKSQLLRQRNRLVAEQKEHYKMIGSSPAMQAVFFLIDRAAGNTSKVLITGESGTGKEMIARAVHHNSARAAGPFVAVNCAAIPENLIESELFGHEKGAFTGAHVRKIGKFEAAHTGTLFLDEIGDTSLMMQAKILRALEDNKIERVGSLHSTDIDVRIIAATNKDLEHEMTEGNFREDLYWRLAVLTLDVPPLRERREDISVLANHFLDEFCRNEKTAQKSMTTQALKILLQQDWPGNIRQLRNIIERLCVLSDNPVIDGRQVSEALKKVETSAEQSNIQTLRQARDVFEAEFIRNTLLSQDWNIQATAYVLGIDRTHLWKKMKRFGIEK